jgi:hypothetical protein
MSKGAALLRKLKQADYRSGFSPSSLLDDGSQILDKVPASSRRGQAKHRHAMRTRIRPADCMPPHA